MDAWKHPFASRAPQLLLTNMLMHRAAVCLRSAPRCAPAFGCSPLQRGPWFRPTLPGGLRRGLRAPARRDGCHYDGQALAEEAAELAEVLGEELQEWHECAAGAYCAQDVAAAWRASEADTDAGNAPPLLRATRAALGALSDALSLGEPLYDAHDGARLLTAVAAARRELQHTCWPNKAPPRWARAGRSRDVQLVALTTSRRVAPAGDDDTVAAGDEPTAFTSVLLLAQAAPAAAARPSADALAAASAAAVLLQRFRELSFRPRKGWFSRNYCEREMEQTRAVCALLAADGAWVRVGSLDSASRLTWSRPFPLRCVDGADNAESGEPRVPEGFLVLARLLALTSYELEQQMRVPARLLHIAAQESREAPAEREALARHRLLYRGVALQTLHLDALRRFDDPLGSGNHSAVYAVRWLVSAAALAHGGEQQGDTTAAVAKVAYQDDAELAEEATVLAQLADAGCASLPRLLYAARSSFSGKVERAAYDAASAKRVQPVGPPPPLQPAFIVTTPVGTPLTVALGRLGHDSPGNVAAVRKALAKRVAENLLDALRAAHARGIGHGNIKFHNIIITPPLDDGDTMTLSDVASRTAVLIDWGTAQRLGVPSAVRMQRGFSADALELLMATQVAAENHAATENDSEISSKTLNAMFYRALGVPSRVPRLVVRPQWDLEAVAYVYAAIRADSRSAYQLTDEYQAGIPPWHPRAARGRAALQRSEQSIVDEIDYEALRRDGALATRAVAETGLAWLGPHAWARYVFLHERPGALGRRGRRFLQHVRAGCAVYTLNISAREDAEMRAAPGGGAPLGAQAEPWDDGDA